MDNDLLTLSYFFSRMDDLWNEFIESDLKPNTLLISRDSISVLKKYYSYLVLNDTIFIYGDNNLEICYTESNYIGLAYSYFTTLK